MKKILLALVMMVTTLVGVSAAPAQAALTNCVHYDYLKKTTINPSGTYFQSRVLYTRCYNNGTGRWIIDLDRAIAQYYIADSTPCSGIFHFEGMYTNFYLSDSDTVVNPAGYTIPCYSDGTGIHVVDLSGSPWLRYDQSPDWSNAVTMKYDASPDDGYTHTGGFPHPDN